MMKEKTIEPQSLLALLSEFAPLDEDFPPIPDDPADPIDF